VTGVTNLHVELTAKRVELLHELIPAARSFAMIVNPSSPILAEGDAREAQQAAGILGVNLSIFDAADSSAIEAAFAAIASQRVGALVTTGNDFFLTERRRLVALAARYAVPAIYAYRESATAGGLASYGADSVEAYRQVGLYTGRILKGEKPSDLPVQQATRIQLVVNMKTAKALGLTVPQSILLRADEVIE
jgi:putative tryptophan/tyrosine transport system substrate-binding protein